MDAQHGETADENSLREGSAFGSRRISTVARPKPAGEAASVNDYSERSSGLFVPNDLDSPQQRILFLVKFVNKVEHVEDLLDGKLFAQRLAWFKRRESTDEVGRLDRHEGTSVWHQPGQIRLVINDWDLTPDLAGPVQMQPNWLDHLNVFCMHAVHADQAAFDRATSGALEDMEHLRRRLLIPERCIKLGAHAVIVTDISEFMRRFGNAVASNGYRAWSHLVRYYDPASFHGQFDGIDPVFRKRIAYSYQREYRFAIWTRTTGNNPIKLDIGDIRDITVRFNSADLNREAILRSEMRIETGPATS